MYFIDLQKNNRIGLTHGAFLYYNSVIFCKKLPTSGIDFKCLTFQFSGCQFSKVECKVHFSKILVIKLIYLVNEILLKAHFVFLKNIEKFTGKPSVSQQFSKQFTTIFQSFCEKYVYRKSCNIANLVSSFFKISITVSV